MEPDRRRLPCFELHRIYPPCAGKADMTRFRSSRLAGGLEENPGFKIAWILRFVSAMQPEFRRYHDEMYFTGCVLMGRKRATDQFTRNGEKICIDFVSAKRFLSHTRFKQICRTMIRDFDHIPITDEVNLALVLSARFSLSSFRRRITIWRSCSKVEGAEPVVRI